MSKLFFIFLPTKKLIMAPSSKASSFLIFPWGLLSIVLVLVLNLALDDAWFSDSPIRADPIDTVVSPEGGTYMVTQTVRDAKTGERVDSGELRRVARVAALAQRAFVEGADTHVRR